MGGACRPNGEDGRCGRRLEVEKNPLIISLLHNNTTTMLYPTTQCEFLVTFPMLRFVFFGQILTEFWSY